MPEDILVSLAAMQHARPGWLDAMASGNLRRVSLLAETDPEIPEPIRDLLRDDEQVQLMAHWLPEFDKISDGIHVN